MPFVSPDQLVLCEGWNFGLEHLAILCDDGALSLRRTVVTSAPLPTSGNGQVFCPVA